MSSPAIDSSGPKYLCLKQAFRHQYVVHVNASRSSIDLVLHILLWHKVKSKPSLEEKVSALMYAAILAQKGLFAMLRDSLLYP